MNWKRIFVVAFALLIALSIGSGRLAAQTSTTGDIAGVVTDPSNAVVPDAKITLKDETKGSVQESKTTKDGNYRFYLLAPGPYTVTVAATGFEGFARRVDVAVGQIATINITLTLGTSSTTVTVTEAAPLLQTDNGDTSTTLSEQQISQVPNPGNDLSYIAQLAPGAVMNTMGGFGNVEAFGLPATSNLFTTNGMDNNDPFLNLNNSGATNLLLGSNEMQEADVVTNGYSGAYGTFAGINVNYVTKSGGNDFHGNLVYYWTGRAMDATDWITKANGESKPFNNANQWAASLGGPIKKDKLFFFLNTEGLRVLIPVPQTIQIPSLAFEQATIQNLQNLGLTASIPYYCQNLPNICPGVGPVPGSGNGIFNFYNSVPNQGTAVPITTPSAGVNNGGCGLAPNPAFPGEVPIPVLAGGTCSLSVQEIPINFAPEWQLAGRVDWNIGVNDRMFVRAQYDHGTQPSVTDPVNPIFNITSDQPEYQGQLVETHTFSPTLVNQFLMAGTWYSAIFKSPNLPATLAAFPTDLSLGDASLTNIGGAIGFVFPQGRNVTQIQFGDDLSKSWGNHGFKVGFKFHRDYVSDHDNGFFTNGLQVPFTLTDFFNGGQNAQMQQNFAQSTNLPIRINNIAGYVQDEWRARPNLTVTGSLRLEHSSNPNCATNCFATFRGGLAQGIANDGQPYNQVIQTGRSTALYKYQNLQWEPRVSFAWQPFGTATGMLKSNFVVRGGIGIFYDIFPGQIADNMSANSPLVNSFLIAGGAAGGTCTGGFLSPNEAGNLFDCLTAANTAFNTAFTSGASTVAAVPGIVTAQNDTKAPQYQKWSLEIQKGFGANDSIDIGYFGNHGIHTPIVNPSLNAFGFGTLPLVAPTDQFNAITQVQTVGISNYNGLVASYKHRFSGLGGGVVQVNYTWSHAFDEISNGGFNSFSGNSLAPQDPFNLRNNYGPADYDARHNLNANYVWQVPVRKALMGHGWAPLVDGWQVSGTVFYRTGFPFSVIDGAESADLGGNNYGGTILPDILNPNVNTHCGNTRASVPTTANGGNFTPCFSTADFVAATTETGFGAQGLRNKFRGPDYFNSDFSVLKNTKIPHWERGQLGIGFQFFNVFNHPNFSFPDNDIASGVFGRTTSMVSPPTSILGSFLGGDASPRLIQLKAQLTF